MNVVRVENTMATRGGRAKGRFGKILPISNPIVNVRPKYEFKTDRRPLVNMAPITTSMTTPKNSRRYPTTTSSSSNRKSALFRRAGQVSGGQISPHSTTSDGDHCIILAITSGRGDARGEVGIAAMDTYFPHMILCQISDSNTYVNTLTKIHTLNPVEIIMPETMCGRSIYVNSLYQGIREKFDTLTITSIPRMHFHDSAGLDRIRTHCSEEFASVELVVKQKYYALAAASALFKYIEYIQHVIYAPKSMRITFEGSQNTAMIDIESAQTLELVSSKGGIGNFSLLGSLDRCSTPMGRRLLRASILQPPCNLDVIKGRQDCVAELVSNRSFHSVVKPVVKRLYGASRLLSLAMLTSQVDSVQAAEKNLNYILLLKNIVDIIPEFRSVMANGEAPFFKKVSEDLKDERYQLIKEKILSVVHPDAKSSTGYTSSNMQRCFAIRSGLNDMLDIARQTYCELIDDMQKLVEESAERYNLPLTLACNAKLGYHIEMYVPRNRSIKIDELPDELIEVHKQKGIILMTTEYLLVLSQHCRDACEELHVMSNVLLNQTMCDLRQHIGCLLKLSDNVGELDLLLSIAQVSSISDYTLPHFGKKLELRESRHPIMDISGMESPVSNDIVANSSHNFQMITGPNMSGKSVYLKQIVLLQIMAQIGSYVPAKKAQFRLADRIFCRMCSRDDINLDNTSSFVLEIKEIRYILQSITPNSLVVLDEICRGTTVEEGTSIAWAICEKLLRTGAYVFNATHFLYLTRLAEFYYNVSNTYFETESGLTDETSTDPRLIYTHRLKPGIATVWNYGIALARTTGLPDEIVKMAREIANGIATSIKPRDDDDDDGSVERGKKICYDCVAEMRELLENGEFNVRNIVKIVNEFSIPKVVARLKINEQLAKERELMRATSLQKFSSNNFHIPMDAQSLSKRLSTTSISSEVNTKKARFSSQKEMPVSTRSPFNYVREKESMRSFDKKSFVLPAKLFGHPSGEMSRDDSDNKKHVENYFEKDSAIFENSTTTNGTNDRENDSQDDEVSFVTVSDAKIDVQSQMGKRKLGESPVLSNDYSQSSVPTYIAKMTAREKEASVFKLIHGDDFDEAAFLFSCQSSGNSDNDDIVIV